MSNTQKVGPGKYVKYAYKLYNEPDGELLFEAKADAPDEMVYGISHEVVPGLIAALKDLAAGDKFSVTLPPEAAFGERYDDNVVTLEKEIFERDGKLAEEVKVGAELPMMTAEGFRILGRVIAIDDASVKMDFNHPFAGKTVKYDGEVIEVRDATPEELQPVGGCGCGHCGSHGDCGDGCDCGDSDCGCGDHGCGGCH
ncbi:MAG: FKBP-type peptidyl-prolyl cis-trans isomerase [Muribaculaceae bacterium]|nr:FKBP-type peptidyl-prolyl cis-trans isomerase [Muribaculaceae bacterium]MDE6330673.1 FKBP-type peptidyl-prolyl cis-trans isomerase [Muribaculaceae bacterium]